MLHTARLMKRLLAPPLLAIVIGVGAVFPILDRGLFNPRTALTDGSSPVSGVVSHDHDLCVVFHANPGLPQAPPPLREVANAMAPPTFGGRSVPSAPPRRTTCHPRAPPLA